MNMSIGRFFEDLEALTPEEHSPSIATRDWCGTFGKGLKEGIKPHYTFKNGKNIFRRHYDPEMFRKACEQIKLVPIPDIVKRELCMHEQRNILADMAKKEFKKEIENMAAKYNYQVPNPKTNKLLKASVGDFSWEVTGITVERSMDRFPRVDLMMRGYNSMTLNSERFDPRLLAGMVTDALNHPNKTFMPQIKDVIFNPPATIVFWGDGSKTVVKCRDEQFDPEKGLAMAYFKKTHGDKYEYYEEMRKWVGRYEKKLKKERSHHED